jgi:hypothetical protein
MTINGLPIRLVLNFLVLSVLGFDAFSAVAFR